MKKAAVGAQVNKGVTNANRRDFNMLRLIHSAGQISRVDLAKKTGSSLGSLTAIAQNLLKAEFVLECGSGTTALGRKPVLLQVRDNLGYFVGVDLGTYFYRLVISDINGRILCQSERETGLSDGRHAVLKRVFKSIHDAVGQSGLPKHGVKGIGIGHSAVIDTAGGMVLSVPRPGQSLEWKNVPLRSLVQEEFGLPTCLYDSVRAIAIAERHFGLGRKIEDFIYIDGGMGFGAGIFIRGELYSGAGGGAGEFGHLIVDEHGPLCCCGNTGCLEAIASCAAIISSARSAIDKGVNSKIRELVNGKLEDISIEIIAAAAKENDALAFRVLNEAVTYIAVALADVINLLNPTTMIFGGALFRAAPELLVEPLNRMIRQRALEKPANDVEFKMSPLGSFAGALGAARLISEDVLERIYFNQQ